VATFNPADGDKLKFTTLMLARLGAPRAGGIPAALSGCVSIRPASKPSLAESRQAHEDRKDEMATEVLGVRFQELLQCPLSGERDVCNGWFALRRTACCFPDIR
jgi:hypothetical protein